MSKPARRWLVIGNPENRRVGLFQQALLELGQRPADVLSYIDLLQDPALLPAALERNESNLLRIESPGENPLVEKLIIARGARATEATELVSKIARLRADPGRIRWPQLWFAGFSDLLQDLATELDRHAELRVQNHPTAIRTLFDKPACHRLLQSCGVAVPRVLPAVKNYDELRTAMQDAGMTRVFVKLACGSSSSGVVALSTANTRPLAITSLELVRHRGEARFYNNLQLSRYNREQDIRTICDFLCGEGAHVEEWLPKARQDERELDLRVVTIGGRARHAVVRTSRSPITNLHLGNRRGDLSSLKTAMGARWKIVTEICEQAAAAFPQALSIGWDLLVTPGFRRAYILEGNAFGDLLPNVLFRGDSTYAATIRVAASQGQARTRSNETG
ncbi:STM4014 family protein [Anatilimnocola floriformis]|uniref:STM4014 family protein n=1 Tax=Anatilimnocola floriformis TaxID=2948575 RepID=UPI0020C4C8C0|nr:STM4014 family protein [Anatilimnocola floriformis]